MTPKETLEKIANVHGHAVTIVCVVRADIGPTPDAEPITDAARAIETANPWHVTVWRNPNAGRVYRAASENAAVSLALNDYRRTVSVGNR